MQLPESLLALLLLSIPPVLSEPWPHNLPKHLKYFPEDEVHVRRGLAVQERLQRERPIGVKKMSADEGEMFMLDNWIFSGDGEQKLGNQTSSSSTDGIKAFSPMRPHSNKHLFNPLRRVAPRAALLFARGFKCPDGTNDCSSIGAPNSCCGAGSMCITIKDTGLGSVGCCANGNTCAGAISCDEANGYTSCPESSNGGCCLPGYSCQDVGCVISGTSITYVLPPATSTPRSSTTTTTTAVVIVPTTPSSAASSPTSSYVCSSGWFSCPANLGGGCCQNGRQCATGVSCLATGSSVAPASQTLEPFAPVRPTSNSNAPKASSTSDSGAALCPVGFYVCSAYYPSGCCRVGRDCQTTGSCVATASETLVNSNGVVIVAPTGASLASSQGGSCQTGWYSCAASLGGNCCPDGYACGNQCTATASGSTQVSDKVAPSMATTFSTISISAFVVSGLAVGIAMVVL